MPNAGGNVLLLSKCMFLYIHRSQKWHTLTYRVFLLSLYALNTQVMFESTYFKHCRCRIINRQMVSCRQDTSALSYPSFRFFYLCIVIVSECKADPASGTGILMDATCSWRPDFNYVSLPLFHVKFFAFLSHYFIYPLLSFFIFLYALCLNLQWSKGETLKLQITKSSCCLLLLVKLRDVTH